MIHDMIFITIVGIVSFFIGRKSARDQSRKAVNELANTAKRLSNKLKEDIKRMQEEDIEKDKKNNP